jgi:16S rRNA (cytosine967-C5)-methyltransferase
MAPSSKKKSVKTSNVRIAAAQIIVEVTRHGRSLSDALPAWQNNIADKDRALLAELCYGVLRHFFALEALAAQLLQKPLKEKDGDVYALLLLSFYQLRHMRTAEHAVVHLAVEAARTIKKEWAGKLLNGVLRQYLRQRELLDAAVAQHHNHPQWLAEMIAVAWPEQAADIFLANNARGGMSLRVNCRQQTVEQYQQTLAEKNIVSERSAFAPNALLLQQAIDVAQLPHFAEGSCSVQDVAAQLCAPLLKLQADVTVLDACCAPGGKTGHILEAAPQLAQLVAIDNSDSRLQRVRDNIARLGFSNTDRVTVLYADAADVPSWRARAQMQPKLFDRILLDAPCSGTGVIRRHPDIKHLRRASDLAVLAQRQQDLLQALWPLLAVGGVLLYTTCSILPQENESTVSAFLTQHTDAVVDRIVADWGIETKSGRQLLPTAHHDGFFFARLTKRAAH